jgi:PIN domain nuclease of toxin-antitoxin system
LGGAKVIVLDTHTWVWWINGLETLSPKARSVIREAIAQKAIYISSISAWEVALLVARGRLQFTMSVADWVARSEALPFVHFVPMDNSIAIRSVQLPAPIHSDPADRIIIATSLALGFPLVSRDEKIAQYPYVRTVW